MTGRKIALAGDHAGFRLKTRLATMLRQERYEVVDLGTHSEDSVDYPDFGFSLAEAVAGGGADLGVAVCGSGIGISIAANRHPGIRAALCADPTSAKLARQHNDANVLALGARLMGEEVAEDTLRAFLSADFEGGRHSRRVDKLSHPTFDIGHTQN